MTKCIKLKYLSQGENSEALHNVLAMHFLEEMFREFDGKSSLHLPLDDFIYSRYFSSWQTIDIVGRNKNSITLGHECIFQIYSASLS